MVRSKLSEDRWIPLVSFHYSDWTALIESLGALFLKRLKDAYAMREKHRHIFQEFSSTFPPQTVKKWEAMVSAWKSDKSKPNPYRETASGPSYHILVLPSLFTYS